jgi:hypothetical protein
MASNPDVYPTFSRVEYESPPALPIGSIPVPDDLSVSALDAMQEVDSAFARQFLADESLRDTYSRQMKGEITKEMVDSNPCLSPQIQTIEKALENRMHFAIRQKNHVKHFWELIDPALAERKRVLKETLEELSETRELCEKFNTPLVTQLADEALDEEMDLINLCRDSTGMLNI